MKIRIEQEIEIPEGIKCKNCNFLRTSYGDPDSCHLFRVIRWDEKQGDANKLNECKKLKVGVVNKITTHKYKGE